MGLRLFPQISTLLKREILLCFSRIQAEIHLDILKCSMVIDGCRISTKINFYQVLDMETRRIKFIGRQANNMKSTTLVCLRNLVCLHVAAASLLFSQPVYPQDSESTAVVYRL